MSKTGLIMEGGAMRGMFTCGVTDVFLEEGITFDGAVGVSAGATFGCNFKSKQHGRPLRYNLRYARDPRYGSMLSLLTTGDYYNEEFCYKRLPDELDLFDNDTYRENPMKFYVVATSVETGKPVYRELPDCSADYDGYRWIQASASMPVFSRPVEIGGKKYLDGGISDSIPLRFMEHLGYEKLVVILTRPADYRKHVSRLQPGMEKILKDYPAVSEAMRRRPAKYNRTLLTIREQEKEGKIFVIRPPETLPAGRIEHNPKKLQETYDIGRAEALRLLPEIKGYLGIHSV